MENHCARIVDHPDLRQYDFGAYHPLRPERLDAGLELLATADLWNAAGELLPARPAEPAELEAVHDPHYIQAVDLAGSTGLPRGELVRYGLTSRDNPPFPDMHYAASMVAGGAIEAVRAVMSGDLKHAFHPAGGLHHAQRARTSGFCVYNDPAIAAMEAVQRYSARVLYIDVDAHHGDGVQWIFYDDPRVVTVSFHESGQYLFPGTGGMEETGEGRGRGSAFNLPFLPFTGDRSWQHALDEVLPRLAAAVRPDLILSAHGADTHEWDPLTHLSLTTASFVHQARLIHRLAHEHAGGRWVAFGSGGYDWQRVVPRSWAILWAEMSGRELPNSLPTAWTSAHTADLEDAPQYFLDQPEIAQPFPRADDIARGNRAMTQDALTLIDALPKPKSG